MSSPNLGVDAINNLSSHYVCDCMQFDCIEHKMHLPDCPLVQLVEVADQLFN